MKALDLLKTILENGLSSYNEEDDTVLVNGWWVTLEECIAELEALQQPKSCEECVHRSFIDEALTNKVTNGFCIENGFFTKRDFCCNRYEAKEQ